MGAPEAIEPLGRRSAGVSGGRVLLQIAILCGLSVCVFWPEMKLRYPRVSESSDMAHVAALPLAVLLLILLRRDQLRQCLGSNSAWGIGLIGLGLAFYAAATWPFAFGYARDLAVLPVGSGIVWVCGGRRLWRRTLPLMLLVFLAVPVGSRVYARLIIRPETYTIAAVTKCTGALPGVKASLHGTDIHFSSRNAQGAIALGESNRGARLLFCYATIAVFVAFSRRRSLARLVVLASLTPVVVLFCNFLRLYCWALVQIVAKVGPVSPWPKYVAAAVSLIACYGIVAALCAFRLHLFVEEPCRVAPAEGGDRHVSA